MVKPSRLALLLLSLLALGLGVWSWLEATGARALSGLAARPAEKHSAEPALPKIALERLDADERAAAAEATRDVFRFGRPPAPAETPRHEAALTPPAPPVDSLPAPPPPPPTLPPFGVKYIGTLEQRGTKIAVLLSDDKKEVLTGREGDTVANRLKIVRIGLESVDVQDVGSDRIRKIPLKGN